MHSVQKLYLQRKNTSTKPFKARGFRVERCENCRLASAHCICQWRHQCHSGVGFLLLMYDAEVLKPSNTGRLIADIIPECFAFIWSRTEVDPSLLSILNDSQWQPFVVFPQDYATESQQITNCVPTLPNNKKPLFIMLDGSWREAKKMFRKSPYLNQFPVLSIDLNHLAIEDKNSQYQIRKAINPNQLATAEVASHILNLAGENQNAEILKAWFNVFTYQYQKSVCRTNYGDPQSLEKYLALK
ncbi:tRNA-uridine aminocarboxypropyltransferase [Thalassotalea profundi]|uniref:tRNA-uridine aminocarboxypropyltransferase n=1 Tax=Thalassotalea profundi TaxID=2036687 RepID=A0ABQ3IM20_9GAMM|nr:tRNA-uridine aminocarboxypropyltransferase [Thalassotalea profundi]GHE86870.1 DTW domain-containing protein [Thalassotalea profundi]